MSNFFKKICWGLAPLLWGYGTWLLAYGPLAHLQITHAIRLLFGITFLIGFFYKTFDRKSIENKVCFFQHQVSIPNWRYPTIATQVLLICYLIYNPTNTVLVLNSLVFGVLGSSCLEEFLARGYFLKYEMSTKEFIFFNTLTSCTFTLMHAGFEAATPSIYELFFIRGHFIFSFMLGLFVYKTKRIEVSLFIHIFSNFFKYTLPILIWGKGQAILALIVNCLELLLLAS